MLFVRGRECRLTALSVSSQQWPKYITVDPTSFVRRSSVSISCNITLTQASVITSPIIECHEILLLVGVPIWRILYVGAEVDDSDLSMEDLNWLREILLRLLVPFFLFHKAYIIPGV